MELAGRTESQMIPHEVPGSVRSWLSRAGLTALAGLCLLAAVAGPAQAATDDLYAAPAATGAGDCGAPADACSIADAVTSANAKPVADNVRIVLAGGVYALPAPSPTALVITFAGPSLTLEAAAGGGTPILDGGSAVRLLSVDAASTVTLDGLAIRSGLAAAGPGGAIDNSGTLTVKRSTFSGNTGGNGGALYDAAGATLDVQDSTFTSNTATSVGGGAILVLGSTTVERSALVGNTASINGGAINVQGSGTATVTSSTLAGNRSGSLGGALSNLGRLTVQRSTLADNTAPSGAVIAAGNANVTFAADLIAAQASGAACNPANTAIVDAGYNLDTDGTCISPTAPATGSHNGQTADGASTYGAVLDAYLAAALADNGGPSQTLALLNRPSPATDLPNPMLDAVPADFALPVAAGGASTACALADQRGVGPVAGARCAIGAYLLQTTRTALAAPEAVTNAPVTLTATITPAAEGGTVAFDDGAGNPASTQCAAQPVAHGTATCTVTYASHGTHAVTATYSGDGDNNNYVGSASASQTVTVTDAPVAPVAPAAAPAAARPVVAARPDRTPPKTAIRRVSSLTQPITLRGTARDAGGIRRVRVSVARHVGKRCRFLQANGTFSKARDCKRSSYVDARGTTSWTLKLPALPHGRYTVWARGIDAAGNVERKDRGRNLLVLALRK
jgi:predicted outer membrane repeat protein